MVNGWYGPLREYLSIHSIGTSSLIHWHLWVMVAALCSIISITLQTGNLNQYSNCTFQTSYANPFEKWFYKCRLQRGSIFHFIYFKVRDNKGLRDGSVGHCCGPAFTQRIYKPNWFVWCISIGYTRKMKALAEYKFDALINIWWTIH